MMLRIAIFICHLLISSTLLWAQNVEFSKDKFSYDKKGLKEAIKNIEAGDEYFMDFEEGEVRFFMALGYYLKANRFNPNNAILNYKLGKCYLHTREKSKAYDHLKKAIELDTYSLPKDIDFLIGYAYQLQMEWDKAIEHLEKYAASAYSESERQMAQKHIEECKVASEMVSNPVRVFIDNLGSAVNTEYHEGSPVISADESVLMITSRRPGSVGGYAMEEGYEYFEDIYESHHLDGTWTNPNNIGEPVNSKGHDATIGLSADGQHMLIYRDGNGGDILECKLEGALWSKPRPLSDKINTEFHESSACFSPDERKLFFVSDVPGGFGGRDIYVSYLDDDEEWGIPRNLGPVINTEYDEESVFMHPDGKTLYFSSQGHGSMGGYDIFMSIYENNEWSEPVNLGYPVNTPDDDIGFVLSTDGKRGYYNSSHGEGFGGSDIYMITFLGPEKPVMLSTEDNLLASIAEPVSAVMIEEEVEVEQHNITILKGLISDAITTNPVGAEIEIIDNEKNEVIANFASNSSSGKYLVALPSGKNYGIAVKAEDYLFHSENFNIPPSQGFREIYKDISLKNVSIGSKIVLRNIFFDTDKATIRQESTAELQRLIKLLSDVPSLKIEISGHTDNQGNKEYNQQLSEKRAKAVVDYLTSHGVETSRLEYQGYGLTQPIASNDSEEGRQQNRRTEFKVLEK